MLKPNAFERAVLAAILLSAVSLPAASQPSKLYEVTGVTVYDPGELLSFAANLVADRTGAVSAEDLTATLELIYREDGYFLAEVFVAEDGRTLIVDEGAIGDLVIEGVDADTFDLIRSYMEPVVGTPAVTQKAFERSVMLVEDIGTISVNAEIDYPPGTNAARLRLVATDGATSQGYITLDHPERDFGEASILTLGQQFMGAFTAGDLLRFEASGDVRFNGDDASIWGAVTYRAPIGGSGTYGEAYIGSVTAQRDADGVLDATDVDGNTAILALGHPFIRDVEAFGYGLLELRRTISDVDVDLGATTQSFESSVTVGGASWIHSATIADGRVFEYDFNLAVGHRDSDPVNFDDGDETFFHLRAGVGVEQPVSWFGPNGTARAEIWGQLTPNRLPGIEQFYIGGRDEERGYSFAEAQGDNGLSGTLEAGRDLFLEADDVLRRVRPFGFLDVGYVRNNDPAATEIRDETFASLGLGLDAEFANSFFARSYVAVPLTDGPTTRTGAPAFYLGLTKSW